jgi:hypothetical protein
MLKTFVRGSLIEALLLTVMMLLAAIFVTAFNAHAESLDALTNQGLSLSNGPLTYSNFTANLSVTPADFGGPNPNSSYSYSMLPTIHEVDVTATSTGLHISGLNIGGFTNGLPEVTLQLSYRVLASPGDIFSMTAGVPTQHGGIAFNGDHRLTATTLAGARVFAEAGDLCRFVHCDAGPVPLNVPLVSIGEIVHYNAAGACRLGPPTRDNVPGCSVTLAFDVSTTFAAVPEPSTWLLLATGFVTLLLDRIKGVGSLCLTALRRVR